MKTNKAGSIETSVAGENVSRDMPPSVISTPEANLICPQKELKKFCH
jgi:hypothetical protein